MRLLSLGLKLLMIVLTSTLALGESLLLFLPSSSLSFFIDVIMFLDMRIKSVLYHVLWPPVKKLGNLGPTRTYLIKKFYYLFILFFLKGLRVDIRVQLIDVTLSNLFACTLILHFIGNNCPISTIFLHKLHQ